MAYRALNLHDLADTAQQVLEYNFPDSEPYLESLQAHKARQTGLLNLMTFGLLGNREVTGSQD